MAAYNLRVMGSSGQANIFATCLKACQDRARHRQIRVAVRGAAAAQ